MARRPISLSLRFSVYARDKHRCQYCGRKPPEVELQIDHVHPVALGGENGIDNLLTACRDCNIGKGARDPGLAMASRPRTPFEMVAEAANAARWWAEVSFCHACPDSRALMWEIAAKAEPEGVEIREGDRSALLAGLIATGALRSVVYGNGSIWVTIENQRGRIDDPAPTFWGLGAVGPIGSAPNLREVH